MAATEATVVLMPPHALAAARVAERLGADAERGISAAEVAARRIRHGWNELAEAPPPPAWRRLLAQFRELVVLILLAAAILSGALGEWADALAILAIVVLNGLLGFFQEERAGRALAALRKLAAPLARVLRDGRAERVPARELVPGDVVEIEAGDFLPADVRLLESAGLRVQEAALTGESLPADKDARVELSMEAPLGDRRNLGYLGTVAVAGNARALVVATGMATELGKIAGALGRAEDEPTPLQRRLAELGRALVLICGAIVALVFALELARGGRLIEVVLTAVSLAVAAVPEGLPAVVTVALALGLQRMVRRNALIRKLPSVETLGCVTVICSDKTGTLTRNEMTVTKLLVGGRTYEVSGAGYSPAGTIIEGDAPVRAADRSDLALALACGARCNHARLAGPDESGAWQAIGDPTEAALLVLAAKGGLEIGPPPRVFHEIPFDSDRKAMSIVVDEGSGRARLYMKGAPEVVLACSSRERAGDLGGLLGVARRAALLEASAALGREGLRVLGLATAAVEPAEAADVKEADLIFLGLVAMKDPPREEARAAVERCHEAGIRPVMITGDHPVTALAIARELGIADPASSAKTGRDLDAVDDEALAREVERTRVYARVTAEHKMRIVRAWRSRGHVVAMTGDGVNDATAIKAADIGIAMGRAGTDVTKEAADMVLTDDNFASIVNAVEEGRGIYDNIQKFVEYLLACNLGEVLLMFVASLIGWPIPLIPVQILWTNLVTDGLPALALGLEPPEAGVMRRPPRAAGEPMIPRAMAVRIAVRGALMAAVALAAFGISYRGRPEALPEARTMAFCVLVYSQLLLALAARSRTVPVVGFGFRGNPYVFGAVAASGLLQLAIVAVPFGRPFFATVGHTPGHWAMLLGLSALPFVAVEAAKGIRKLREGGPRP